MKKEIKLLKFIDLRYADPISAIDLTDDILVYGTMLGATKYYNINQQKLVTLSEIQDEYISGIKINQNQLYICIGDAKILIYNLSSPIIDENLSNEEKNNYETEEEHSKYCENCLTMLNNNYLIRTYIDFPAEPKDDPITKDTEISVKDIYDNEEIKRKIVMSNYSVPFDFDGKNYIFIDFIKKDKRTFNVYDITLQQDEMKKKQFEIEAKFNSEKFGHISHLQIIKDDTLFIVRNYNICEIRDFNLEKKKQLNIKANEILAYDILFKDNDENEDVDNENNNKAKDIADIIILDLDCNIFIYDYKEDTSELLFNLEKNELGIDKIIREQRFFSFGYPYYIKLTTNHIAISSDYGCILFQYS